MSKLEHQVFTHRSPRGWAEWERFLDAAVGATVYHREGWLRSVAEGIEQEVLVHAVTEAGKIRAGAVVRRGGRLGLRSAHKPWATAYNGIATDRDAQPQHVEALCAGLRNAFASVRLVQAPDQVLYAAMTPEWTLGAWTTLVLDVREPRRFWEACDRRVRQRVRKARDLGVTVSRSKDADAFEDLYRLTYRRQGLALNLPPGGIARTVGAACDRGLVRLLIASTSNGEPAAGLVVGENARRAYFMLSASHPMLRQSDATTLLWWTAIEECAARVETVDLVGTGTSEIERFKRSFSPTAVDCVDAVSQAWRWKLARRLADVVHV